LLTDPKLRSQVDALWDKLCIWGLANLLGLQEEFAPFGDDTGVVALASCQVYRDIERCCSGHACASIGGSKCECFLNHRRITILEEYHEQ
jgi:hypothetical protein